MSRALPGTPVCCAAVLFGDRLAAAYLVELLTGRRSESSLGTGNQPRMAVGPDGAGLFLAPETPRRLQRWPGGDAIWLVPERGPTLAEAGDFYRFLQLNRLPPGVGVLILVCLPPDETEAEAEASLDRIAEMASHGLPDGVQAELRVIWLQPNGSRSAGEWLQTCFGAGG